MVKRKLKSGGTRNGRWARYVAMFVDGAEPAAIAARFRVSREAVHKALRAARKKVTP